MTDKEKVKAYDGAIERAKKVLIDYTSEERNVVEYLHPELKESEGEEIKQELIEYHKAQAFLDGKPNNKHVKFVAWLEKQGEQKSLSEEDENIIEWLIGYLEYQIMNVTITEEKDNCLDAISMLKSLKDRVQPKQEWSKEDEAMIDYLLQLIQNSHKKPCTKGLIAFGAEAWLKSLRPQSTWKPSDEQMDALKKNNKSIKFRCRYRT